jgi:hypothetical protein
MSHRISSRPTTGTQRVERAINNPNEPTACRMCGSLYFMEVPAQMYSMGGYGVRSVSTTQMRIYMCPCGEILTPAGLNNGNPAGGERDLFAWSLATALAYRAETGVEAPAKGVAGVHELQELRATIAALQTQINQLSGRDPAPQVVDATEDDQDTAEAIDGDLVAPQPMATGARGLGQRSSGCPQPGRRDDKFLSGGQAGPTPLVPAL